MTAAKFIEEIMLLPREEQSRVLEFAFKFGAQTSTLREAIGCFGAAGGRFRGSAEVDRLKLEITRGFYSQ